MKAHDLARALLAGPDTDVVWEDATGNDGETAETRPYVHKFLTVVESVRVTSDQKIVVIQTGGDIMINPDCQI
jgi:hypothetical protein